MVQANWNIGGTHLRETTYIPTCDDPKAGGGVTGFEDDYDDPKYQVNHRGKGGMGTIREDAMEESKYSDGKGSDTAYFSHDEDEDHKPYDSQEEADFHRRESQLYQGVTPGGGGHGDGYEDDEDHQPYNDEDGGGGDIDEEEQQRRLRDEFGEERS
jgi:hypothetical protein